MLLLNYKEKGQATMKTRLGSWMKQCFNAMIRTPNQQSNNRPIIPPLTLHQLPLPTYYEHIGYAARILPPADTQCDNHSPLNTPSKNPPRGC